MHACGRGMGTRLGRCATRTPPAGAAREAGADGTDALADVIIRTPYCICMAWGGKAWEFTGAEGRRVTMCGTATCVFCRLWSDLDGGGPRRSSIMSSGPVALGTETMISTGFSDLGGGAAAGTLAVVASGWKDRKPLLLKSGPGNMSPSSPSSPETGERHFPASRADCGGCQEFGTAGTPEASLLMHLALLLGCNPIGDTKIVCEAEVKDVWEALLCASPC
mmetsp:Transcript_54924/g.131181  ORF Transcript_54924/g.131181 Transcript_54924/m.131181 type:complete len:221 (+) Transcript_54924:113-775(+)